MQDEQELIVMISKKMPEQLMISKTEEALHQYKTNPCPKTKEGMKMWINMLALRLVTENESVAETIEQTESLKMALDLIGKKI